jgi:segregation and condensation protein B
MDGSEVKGKIEALLFASEEPISIEKLRECSGGRTKTIRGVLSELAREYDEGGRAFELKEVAGGYQLYTRKEFSSVVAKLHKGRRSARLSKAALETLAVVAFRQPVTKAVIESVRGVNADGVVHTLLERDLIQVVGKAKGLGGPLLYATTKEFLRYFHLKNIEELPKASELRGLG